MTYVRPSSLMVIEENPPLREAAKGSRRYLWIGPARRAVSTLPFPSMLWTARVSLVHHIDRHRLSDELSTNARDARRREIDFSTSGQAIRNVQNVFELAAILSKSAPASGRPTPRYDGQGEAALKRSEAFLAEGQRLSLTGSFSWRVRLSVQDAGVGFDPQAADRLFEAFYTTKNYSMGIGLSVSRSIIESHHGRLWAAPNDGPGAPFSFSIPRRPEDMTSVPGLGAIRTPVAANTQLVMRNL
jgi:hypothetical protein